MNNTTIVTQSCANARIKSRHASRAQRGATLALTAATAFIIVIVAGGLLLVIKQIGGYRALTDLCDAGHLRLTKEALRYPSVNVRRQLGPDSVHRFALPDPDADVNLANFNKVVGQTLLIAMNAQADGDPAAIAEVNQVIDKLYGNNRQSLGGELEYKFKNEQVPLLWAMQGFTFGNATTTRMLGGPGIMTIIGQIGGAKVNGKDYAAAYLDQRSPGTNLMIGDQGKLFDQMPLTNYATGAHLQLPQGTTVSDGNKIYLKGYAGVEYPNGPKMIAGVPMPPNEQPHLVSKDEFESSLKKPAPIVALGIPPVGFKSGMIQTDQTSGKDAHVTACSMVACPGLEFKPAIPKGYLEISNRSFDPNNDGKLPSPNTLPSLNNVAANELGTGIDVDPYTMSFCIAQPGLIDKWRQYNYDIEQHYKAPYRMSNPYTEPPVSGIYKKDGTPAARQDCKLIGYNPNKTPPDKYEPPSAGIARCTDKNSLGDQFCRSLFTDQNTGEPPGMFDQVYHPGATYGRPAANAGDLIATEASKMAVFTNFGMRNGSAVIYPPPKATGLRLYPDHKPWLPLFPLKGPTPHDHATGEVAWRDPASGSGLAPWSDRVPGQVTKDGTVLELFRQADPNKDPNTNGEKQLRNFITNRLRQIKPDKLTSQEIDAVLNQKLKLGETYYAYLGPNDSIVMTKTRPAVTGSVTPNNKPLGKPHVFATTYGIYGNFVNAGNDSDVHDHLYMTPNGGSGFAHNQLQAIDSARFIPESGAKLRLGVIEFENKVIGQVTVSDPN